MSLITPRSLAFSAISALVLSALPLTAAASDVAYSARFTLQKAPMRLVIHKATVGVKARIVTASGVEQARCTVKNLERDEMERPVAADMECKSTQFAPLTRQATLFWPNGMSDSAPALRFGTWLEGYEQVRLNVEVDHLARVQKNQLHAKMLSARKLGATRISRAPSLAPLSAKN